MTETVRKPPGHDGSVGELVSAVAADAQTLLRQELSLAKAEMREEATQVGKSAGMFGGAGFAVYMVAVFGSLAGAAALANVMDGSFAALIIAGAWAVIGAALFTLARLGMRRMPSTPQQTLTVQTMKENAQWARHPRHPRA